MVRSIGGGRGGASLSHRIRIIFPARPCRECRRASCMASPIFVEGVGGGLLYSNPMYICVCGQTVCIQYYTSAGTRGDEYQDAMREREKKRKRERERERDIHGRIHRHKHLNTTDDGTLPCVSSTTEGRKLRPVSQQPFEVTFDWILSNYHSDPISMDYGSECKK